MFNSTVLDVVIGLVFIYLLYSLLASVIQEIVATSLSFRAKILEKSIVRMLQDDEENTVGFIDRAKSWFHILFNKKITKDKSLSELFYQHPLLKYLGEDKWYSKPSYLNAKNFSKVIVDLLRGENTQAGDDFRPLIEKALQTGIIEYNGIIYNIEKATLKYLNSLWIDANGDIQKYTIQLENWFNETQERATGWYKRYTQVLLFTIGLIIAIAFNVNTLEIVKKLSKDPELRSQLVNQAENYIKANPDLKKEMAERQSRIDKMIAESTGASKDSLKNEAKYLDSLSKAYQENMMHSIKKSDSIINTDLQKMNQLLGLGWTNTCERNPKSCKCYCIPIPNNFDGGSPFGWIITAIAISMGAPFWFDLLNKLFKLRGSSKEEKNNQSSGNQANTPTIVPKG